VGATAEHHALELVRVDDAGASRRVVITERSFPDVRDELPVLAVADGDLAERCELTLVEQLEAAEGDGEAVVLSYRRKGMPGLALAAVVSMAILGSTNRDHATTLSTSEQLLRRAWHAVNQAWYLVNPVKMTYDHAQFERE